jgi:hypothetical protein
MEQRPNHSLAFKFFFATGGEEIGGTVSHFPTPPYFSFRKLRASFDPFDHAVYYDCVEHNTPPV